MAYVTSVLGSVPKSLNFIMSVSVHVCVYDVGCFVDVLASRSGYCVRNLVFQ